MTFRPRTENRTDRTVIIGDREAVGNVLEQLSALGVAIALDDFGTGYAGLDTVKSLPIACLKIDKTFVPGHRPVAAQLKSFRARSSWHCRWA